jgi:hypothetical protein
MPLPAICVSASVSPVSLLVEGGNAKGEDVASALNQKGFHNISITSGHPAERFKKFKFLRSVISKSVPF